MHETSHVIITRPRWGGRDLLRAYRILIDDQDYGKIKRGQRINIDIAPGNHIAIARIANNGSRPVEFTTQPGQTVHLEVAPGGNGFQFWHAYKSTGYLRLTLLSATD
ncbi:hypothetical protein ACFQ07_02715 [Actinomadura adrarensis]|uniref:Uncharacterized protein n=1 Tax=Actinomadura adrarensis TaxID=1819600 RepID=A0ABW3CB06_9ACTN